jgi:hypothetical protein
MLGKSHVLVANLAMACLSQEERHILYPRWGGIESGATLSDEFKIMWEPERVGSKTKQLVHRCYVDSKENKNHGCITRALDHFEGSMSFIQAYLDGQLDGYTENDFLENLGMFLGITSHHIADLCTPVHVGHKINYESIGFSSLSRLHNQVERDILRCEREMSIRLSKPKIVKPTKSYFRSIAKDTYENSFVNLEEIYKKNNPADKIDMTSRIMSNAINHTANVWHTILSKTGMVKRKWSMQPLL